MSYNLPHFTRQYRDKYGRALTAVRNENRKLRLENDRLRGFCERFWNAYLEQDGSNAFGEELDSLFQDVDAARAWLRAMEDEG